MSSNDETSGDNQSPKFYVSEQQGACCERHATMNAGAYLTAEIRQPNNTVSTRAQVDGIEVIITPTGSWLVLTEEQGGWCDDCELEAPQ